MRSLFFVLVKVLVSICFYDIIFSVIFRIVQPCTHLEHVWSTISQKLTFSFRTMEWLFVVELLYVSCTW